MEVTLHSSGGGVGNELTRHCKMGRAYPHPALKEDGKYLMPANDEFKQG